MRKRDDMTFENDEYESRISALRGRIAERQLDAVVITDPENIMYLTDYQTTGYSFFQCLVVPLEQEPFMITRAMEESNVIARTWVDVTRPYGDTGDAIQTLVDALTEFHLADKRIGYERNSYFFPAYQQDRIRTTLTSGKLLDCFGIVEEGRICKSPAEIEVMRKASLATEAGMRAGLAVAQAGVIENEIGAAISEAMFRAGGEPPAVMPYVTSGPRTMIGHATWEGRTVKPGEHVFLEVGGCYRRYHTAMMRTAIMGDLTDSMYKAQECMKRALVSLHREVRPGVTVSDIDNMIRDICMQNGVGARLITRSGYAIGIAFPPSWDEGYIVSLKGGDSTVLKEGMTFHVIPWLWGVDGDKTCGISDTIYITSTGCESFFSLDRDFTVKPDQAASAVPNTVTKISEKSSSSKAKAEKAGESSGQGGSEC